VRAEKGLNGGLPASSSNEASSMPKSSSSSEPTSDRGALRQGMGKALAIRLMAAFALIEINLKLSRNVVQIQASRRGCNKFTHAHSARHHAVCISMPTFHRFRDAIIGASHAKRCS